MALTSVDTFTETSDIGNEFWTGIEISADIAYYGILKTASSDTRDYFIFSPTITGEYRLSWEFDFAGGDVSLFVNPNLTVLEEMFVDREAAVDGGTIVTLAAGAIYALLISYRPAVRDGFPYGFEFVLGDAIDDRGVELIGGPGSDHLEGGIGPDRLIGGGGHDVLRAAEGFDLLFGGDGDDRLEADGDGGRLFGGTGHDRLEGGGLDLQAYGGKGRDDLHVEGATGQRVIASLGPGRDALLITVGAVSEVSVHLGAGRDYMQGSAAQDMSGNDVQIVVDATMFHGGAGNDYMIGVGRLYGGADHDHLFGAQNSLVTSILVGGEGGDRLTAGSHVNRLGDRLFGGAGKDRLFGGSGRDTLDGGLGRDVISSGTGRDVIRLGGDAGKGDVVVYEQIGFSSSEQGKDRIFGFESGQDKIDLSYVAEQPHNQVPTELAFSDMLPAAKSVWYEINDIVTYVRADVDGDAVADMEIMLFDVGALTEADFIL